MFFAFLLLTSVVRADDQRCLQAYEKAQIDEQRGRLVEARRQLKTCADASCPALVRNDCAQWSIDVAGALPWVTFQVQDEQGRAVNGWRAYRSGRQLFAATDGQTLAIDPGDYELRFEAEGFSASVVGLSLHEAEKRQISVRMLRVGVASPAGVTAKMPSHLPTVLYVSLGAGAVVGLGLFTAFGLKGHGELSDLNDCRPRCDPELVSKRIDSVDHDYLIADLSLAVAGVSVLALALLYIGDETGAFSQRAQRRTPDRGVIRLRF